MTTSSSYSDTKTSISDWFSSHFEDIKKERDILLKKKRFMEADTELQDEYYNHFMGDYIDDYNAQKNILELAIAEIDKKLAEEVKLVQSKKDDFLKENESDILKIEDIIEILSSERDKLNNIQNNIKEFKESIDSLRKKMDEGKIAIDTIKKQHLDAFSKIENTIEEYKKQFNLQSADKKIELEKFIKNEFHISMGGFIESMVSKLEEHKASQMNLIDEYCKSPKQKEFIQKLALSSSKIEETKTSIDNLQNRITEREGHHIRNDIGWLIIFIFISLLDFIFFKIILTDLFSIEGGDPYGLASSLIIITITIPIILVILYHFGRKMFKEGERLLGSVINVFVFLVILILIGLSLFNVQNIDGVIVINLLNGGKNGDITEDILQFALRLSLIPIFLVGDYILNKIQWNNLAKLTSFLFFPILILLFTIKKCKAFFDYIIIEKTFLGWHEDILKKHETLNKKLSENFTPRLDINIDFSNINTGIGGYNMLSDTPEHTQHNFDAAMKNVELLTERLKKASEFIEKQIENTNQLKSLKSSDINIKLQHMDIDARHKMISLENDKNRYIGSLDIEQKKFAELKAVVIQAIRSHYNKIISKSESFKY